MNQKISNKDSWGLSELEERNDEMIALASYVSNAGISGFNISCIANFDQARIDFYMDKSDAAKNKAAFDTLVAYKEEIEQELGVSLTWERVNEYKASWLCYK